MEYVLIEVHRVKHYSEKSLILKIGAKWEIFIPKSAYGGHVRDNLHRIKRWVADKNKIEYYEEN